MLIKENFSIFFPKNPDFSNSGMFFAISIETELGIKENNIAVPDLGFAELKSHRENHTGLVTLFTFNRKAWKIKPLLAIEKYGSYDRNNRRGCIIQSPKSQTVLDYT